LKIRRRFQIPKYRPCSILKYNIKRLQGSEGNFKNKLSIKKEKNLKSFQISREKLFHGQTPSLTNKLIGFTGLRLSRLGRNTTNNQGCQMICF
jgi:hypothetical protein